MVRHLARRDGLSGHYPIMSCPLPVRSRAAVPGRLPCHLATIYPRIDPAILNLRVHRTPGGRSIPGSRVLNRRARPPLPAFAPSCPHSNMLREAGTSSTNRSPCRAGGGLAAKLRPTRLPVKAHAGRTEKSRRGANPPDGCKTRASAYVQVTGPIGRTLPIW